MFKKFSFILFLIFTLSISSYATEDKRILTGDEYNPSYEPIVQQPEQHLTPEEQERQTLKQEFDAMIHPFEVVGATKEFIDSDKNGKYESFVITLDITSQASDGPYRIEAGLTSSEKNFYQSAVHDQCDLTDGACSVRFDFPCDSFLVYDLADVYSVNLDVYALKGTLSYDFAERMIQKYGKNGELFELQQRGMDFMNIAEVFSFMMTLEQLPALEPREVILGRSDEVRQEGIRNDEGEIEHLRVIIPVLSRYQTEAGLSACLYDDPDASSKHSLICQEFSCMLHAGRSECPVDFDAAVLSQAEASGPYEIYIHLASHYQGVNTFYQVRIPGFEADQYIRPDVVLKQKRFSDWVGDKDGNGFYEVLVVQSKVTVKAPGEYIFNGNLADASGNYIGFFSQKQSLRAEGEEQVSLGIPGGRIKGGEFNGPYRFYDCLLYLDQGMSTPKNLFSEARCDYQTQAYQSADFE